MAKTEQLAPMIPSELKREFIKWCKTEGMTVSGAVTKALREFLAARKAA